MVDSSTRSWRLRLKWAKKSSSPGFIEIFLCFTGFWFGFYQRSMKFKAFSPKLYKSALQTLPAAVQGCKWPCLHQYWQWPTMKRKATAKLQSWSKAAKQSRKAKAKQLEIDFKSVTSQLLLRLLCFLWSLNSLADLSLVPFGNTTIDALHRVEALQMDDGDNSAQMETLLALLHHKKHTLENIYKCYRTPPPPLVWYGGIMVVVNPKYSIRVVWNTNIKLTSYPLWWWCAVDMAWKEGGKEERKEGTKERRRERRKGKGREDEGRVGGVVGWGDNIGGEGGGLSVPGPGTYLKRIKSVDWFFVFSAFACFACFACLPMFFCSVFQFPLLFSGCQGFHKIGAHLAKGMPFRSGKSKVSGNHSMFEKLTKTVKSSRTEDVISASAICIASSLRGKMAELRKETNSLPL